MDSADDLREHVQILATAEGRSLQTPGHKRARKYLDAILKHHKMVPYAGDNYELLYKNESEELVNIIAVAPGKNRDAEPVLIAAHYDTFGSLPGADDNAAAIAITLEIGRDLIREPAESDVILAFFDGEELGYLDSMGSAKFYKEQTRRHVKCALVMDLVGHDVPIEGLENTMFVTGMETSSTFASILKETEPATGLRWATVLNSYVGGLSDHHIYSVHNEAFLFFSCARWEHYHQATDTPEKLNYTKMASFKDALLSVVRACAKQDLDRSTYDSTKDELHFLSKNLKSLPGMGAVTLKSRKDIDALVAAMLKRFDL